MDKEGNIISKENVGIQGEICVVGESLALGYINNQEATKKHLDMRNLITNLV